MARISDFRPERIYVLNKIRDEEVTRRVLESPEMKGIYVEYVDIPAEFTGEEFVPIKGEESVVTGPVNIPRGRALLFIRKTHSDKGVVEEPDRQGVVSLDVFKRNGGRIFNVKLGGMCMFRCHYCYMYGAMKNSFPVAINADVARIQSRMAQNVEESGGRPCTFNLGEHTDSLALDHLTRMTTDFIPFVTKLPNSQIELRTKSANVQNLKGLDHKGRTIVGFTLSPQLIIDESEGDNAVPIEDRIEAVRQCQEWGYPVSLKLDPVIPFAGWRDAYADLIDRLADTLDPKLVHHYAIGVLRWGSGLQPLCQAVYPDSKLWQFDFPDIEGKKQVQSKTDRREIYLHVLPRMRVAFPGVDFYLSMETVEFAETIEQEADSIVRHMGEPTVHHVHYVDVPDKPGEEQRGTYRLDIKVAKSQLTSPLFGVIEWLYQRDSKPWDFVSNQMQSIKPFVRNGMFAIEDVFDVGTIITIALRKGNVLEDILVDKSNPIRELVNDDGMLYWIRIGRTGVFSLQAKVVQDKTDKIEKLRANLQDIPLRQLLAEKAKVKLPQDPVREEDYPSYMDAERAARYLDISIRTFYDIPREELPQAPHGRYRKKDLDKYMEDNLLHKKRPRKNAQIVPKKNVNDADSEESSGEK